MSLRTDWDFDFGEQVQTERGFIGEVAQRQEWMQQNGNTRTRYFIRAADGRGMWFRRSALHAAPPGGRQSLS